MKFFTKISKQNSRIFQKSVFHQEKLSFFTIIFQKQLSRTCRSLLPKLHPKAIIHHKVTHQKIRVVAIYNIWNIFRKSFFKIIFLLIFSEKQYNFVLKFFREILEIFLKFSYSYVSNHLKICCTKFCDESPIFSKVTA